MESFGNDSKRPEAKRFVKALYDFEGNLQKKQISCKKGEILLLGDSTNHNWWWVATHGKGETISGWIPSGYVEVYTPPMTITRAATSATIINPSQPTPKSKEEEKSNPGSISKFSFLNLLTNFVKSRPGQQELLQRKILLTELNPEAQLKLSIDVVSKVASFIAKKGVHEEGIYRISGPQAEVRRFCFSFSRPEFTLPPDLDVHVAACALKLYFREVSPPLIPFEYYQPLIDVHNANVKDAERVSQTKAIIKKIQNPNLEILKIIAKHLVVICNNSAENKMNHGNLGIVFGGTILRPRAESPELTLSHTHNKIRFIEVLINNYADIFLDDMPASPISPRSESPRPLSPPPPTTAPPHQAPETTLPQHFTPGRTYSSGNIHTERQVPRIVMGSSNALLRSATVTGLNQLAAAAMSNNNNNNNSSSSSGSGNGNNNSSLSLSSGNNPRPASPSPGSGNNSGSESNNNNNNNNSPKLTQSGQHRNDADLIDSNPYQLSNNNNNNNTTTTINNIPSESYKSLPRFIAFQQGRVSPSFSADGLAAIANGEISANFHPRSNSTENPPLPSRGPPPRFVSPKTSAPNSGENTPRGIKDIEAENMELKIQVNSLQEIIVSRQADHFRYCDTFTLHSPSENSEENSLGPYKIAGASEEAAQYLLCLRCGNNARALIFFPCQHYVLCRDCGDLLRGPPVCGLCKAKVLTIVDVGWK